MTDAPSSTDSTPPPPADGENTDAPTPTPSQAPEPHWLPGALWVLVVIGCFLAGAALWFALFGSPQRIGPDAVVPSAGASGSATSTPTANPPKPLTEGDVRSVLQVVDYFESTDASSAEYDHAFARVLQGVDLVDLARSTLDSTSAVTWIEPGTGASRRITGAEKNRRVEEALGYWVSARDASGTDAPALNELWGLQLNPPDPRQWTLQDSLLQVMVQGLKPLSLMFGARDADDLWTWTVESVSITGTDMADVTYVARTFAGSPWRFADPRLRYVKHLRFSQDADGRWRLSAWTNYPSVQASFNANVSPPDSATNLDEWWSSL